MRDAHVHFGNTSEKAISDPKLLERISHRSVDAFLTELQRCLKDENRTKPKTLRFDTQFEEINNGCVQVQVVVGYMEGEFLREIEIDCGKDYLGGDPEATALADTVYERFAAASNALGLEFAGGQYMVM